MTKKKASSFCLPKEILKFLDGIAKNNNREWFDEHRGDYRDHFVEPLKDFTVVAGAAFAKKLPGLRYEPRINGSIFRLNRDIRFSKNKQPYKSNGGVFLWVGAKKKLECPGLYFHLEPEKLMIGAGAYMFTKDGLDRYRRYVASNGAALAKAVAKAEKAGFILAGEKLKRVPAGFEKDHKYAELLKHKGLYVGKDFPAKKAVTGDLLAFLEKELTSTIDMVKALEKALFL